MRTVTTTQMQEIDRIAIQQYGIPSICLMENAGRQVARETLKLLKSKSVPKVLIFCGLGNNAGDGFVAARHLINFGINIKVLLIGHPKKLKGDALINFKILDKLSCPIKEIKKVDLCLKNLVKNADLIVDAIFGTGLSRDIQGLFRDVISMLNECNKYVLAVDIPSGLNGSTGDVNGICIKASRTITFAYAKKGFYKKYGPKCAGKVIVADIGIPKKILKEI